MANWKLLEALAKEEAPVEKGLSKAALAETAAKSAPEEATLKALPDDNTINIDPTQYRVLKDKQALLSGPKEINIPSDVTPTAPSDKLDVGSLSDTDTASKLAHVTPQDPNSLQSKWQDLQDIANKNKAAIAAAIGTGAAGAAVVSGMGSSSPQASSQVPTPPKSSTQTAPVVASKDEEKDETSPAKTAPATAPKTPSQTSVTPDSSISDKIQEYLSAKSETSNLGNVQQLQDAQSRANQGVNLANLAQGMTQAAYTMAGQGKSPFDSTFQGFAKQAELGPAQYAQQVEFQKQDPNSPGSQQARALFKIMGGTPNPNASQADLEKLSPVLERYMQSKESMAVRQEMAKGRQATMQMHYAQMAQNAQMVQEARADDKQRAAYNQTVQQLEQLRGSPAVSQAEKDIYASSKVNDLVKSMGGDPNNLNPQQVNLLVSEVGKIAAGGSSTQSELNYLTPNTLTGQLSGVWQQLINKPTPANAGRFIKQYQNYANDITNEAKKTIKDRYGRIINSKSSQFSDEQKQNLQDNYINRFENIADKSKNTPAAPLSTATQPVAQSAAVPANSQDPKIAKYASDHGLQYDVASKVLAARGNNAGQ